MADRDDPKYKDFEIVSANYKEVKGHAIRADVLIPKSLSNKTAASPRPILVRFHGGFFIVFGCLSPMLFNPWILELAKQQEAIVVTANYRLLPQSNGMDILSDVDSLIGWLSTGLNPLLESQKEFPGLRADTSRVLVVGESAGGYLSTQAGLRHGDKIKAVISQFPVLDLESKFFATSYEKTVLGTPMLPASTFDDYMAKLGNPPEIRSEDSPPTAMEFTMAVVQRGKFPQLMGPEDEVYPFRLIEKGAKIRPQYLVLHGSEDSAVPVEHSVRWMELVKMNQGAENVALIVRPGEHGFESTATIEDEWLKPELTKIVNAWVGRSARDKL